MFERKRSKRGSFYICTECGASLDPGEICDCERERAMQNTDQEKPERRTPAEAASRNDQDNMQPSGFRNDRGPAAAPEGSGSIRGRASSRGVTERRMK